MIHEITDNGASIHYCYESVSVFCQDSLHCMDEEIIGEQSDQQHLQQQCLLISSTGWSR